MDFDDPDFGFKEEDKDLKKVATNKIEIPTEADVDI